MIVLLYMGWFVNLLLKIIKTTIVFIVTIMAITICFEDVIFDLQKALGPRVSCVELDGRYYCGKVLK